MGLLLARVAGAQTVANPGFETPDVGPIGGYYSFQFDPAGAAWIFTGQAGIAANGSGYVYYRPAGTPDGNQFAFLEEYEGTGGSMSQTISGFTNGTYIFTFIASQRDIPGRDNTRNQAVAVSLDGVPVGTFTPADTNWYAFATGPISVAAGTHALSFATVVTTGNETILIDSVGVTNVTVITWAAPGAIVYGTPLSFSQLDATASVPGFFAYNLPEGTVLDAGTNILSVAFIPSNTLDYASVTDSVSLVVSPAPLTVTAANASLDFGQSNPVLMGTISGVTNGDDITATYSCSVTATSPIGTYSIVPSLVDPNNRQTNYTVTLIDGTLTVTVNESDVPNPANDDFTNRQVISGLTNIVAADNTFATTEPGEPDIGGQPPNQSVWYAWTAPANGIVSLYINTGDPLAVAVYLGNCLTNLAEVSDSTTNYSYGVYNNPDVPIVTFPGVAGTTYQIAVDNTGAEGIAGYPPGYFALSFQSTPPLPPPPNDAFSNAFHFWLTGNVTVTGYNVGATPETTDPVLANAAGKTVWWLWYPGTNGYVTIDTIGSDFDTVLAVYYANGPLQQVALDYGFPGGSNASSVTFYAFAGQSYYICVDGDLYGPAGSTAGNIVLNFTKTPAPPNDMLSNASQITGLSAGQTLTIYGGNNVLATTEPGDPPYPYSSYYEAEHSLWWTWTAPDNMDVTITTDGSTCSTYLSVCVGGGYCTNCGFQDVGSTFYGDCAGVTVVSSAGPGFPGDDPAAVQLGVLKGETLFIAVDGLNNVYPYSQPTLYGDVGDIVLNFYTYPVDSNDAFSNSVVLSGDSAQAIGSNLGATNEPGEAPYSAAGQIPDYASVWYTWTAPYSGGAVVQLNSPGFPDGYNLGNPIVSVYTGNSLPSLAVVARDASSFSKARVAFTAEGGQTYQFEVDGFDAGRPGAGEGDFQLTLNLRPPPANDLFANATVITGNYYTNSASFLGASREAGELSHGQADYPQTLWWTWTAPTNTGVVSSVVSLAADAVSFPPAIAVYQGNSVSNVTLVALNQQSSGVTTLAWFTATAGSTYRIALAGEEQYPAGNIISPRWGDYRFRLNNRALALTIQNAMISSDTDSNGNYDFTAEAVIADLGPAATGPLRVYVSDLSGVSVQGPDNGSASDGPAIFQGVFYPSPTELPALGSNTIQISGSLPPKIGGENDLLGTGYGAYAELQEQHAGTNWITVDQTLVLFGDWPTLNGNPGPGGGVIRLDPDYVGLSAFDPLQPPVLIAGPQGVFSGSSASYIGQAIYASGTHDSFTNTSWQSSLFTITNGLFRAGHVSSNTPVTLSAEYSYAGFQYTASLDIIVSNLPPPTLTVPSLGTNGAVELALEGLPDRKYVIEAASNLAPPGTWTAIVTNTAGSSGLLHYTDATSRTNFQQRFYRALLLP